MSELKELLAAEAVRRQPTRQRPFADLLHARRRRDRRNRVVTGAALALVVALGGVGSTILRDGSAGQQSGDGGVAVTGTLVMIGGPLGTAPRGVSGTVSFAAVDGAGSSAVAADDGRFTATVQPGRYVVTGTPSFSGGPIPCQADGPVAVPAGGLSGVRVACHVR